MYTKKQISLKTNLTIRLSDYKGLIKLGMDNIRKINPNGGFVIPKPIRIDMKIKPDDRVQLTRVAKGQYLLVKFDEEKFNQLMTIDSSTIYSVAPDQDGEGNDQAGKIDK